MKVNTKERRKGEGKDSGDVRKMRRKENEKTKEIKKNKKETRRGSKRDYIKITSE